jgi:hypothetical protein
MRRHSITTNGGDPWHFYASAKKTTYSIVGKQERMADGTLRSWFRANSTKRVWTLTFDVLERAEKEMIILLAEQVENLTYLDDIMTTGVEVQIDRDSLSFDDLRSDEKIYNGSIRLLEV